MLINHIWGYNNLIVATTRKGRISKNKQNRIFDCFVGDARADQAAGMVKVSRDCINRYYRRFREAIYQNSINPPRFSGEIEMDQSEFGGRRYKKLQTLKKHYADTLPYTQYKEKRREIFKAHKVIVFGIRQRGGRVYTQIIEKADAKTLQSIIGKVVEPGSVVYTDMWRGFSGLGLLQYQHKTVNHSEEFVSEDGAHTNGIESFWSFAKRRLKKFNGISSNTLRLHVKECEFRFNNKENLDGALKQLL